MQQKWIQLRELALRHPSKCKTTQQLREERRQKRIEKLYKKNKA